MPLSPIANVNVSHPPAASISDVLANARANAKLEDAAASIAEHIHVFVEGEDDAKMSCKRAAMRILDDVTDNTHRTTLSSESAEARALIVAVATRLAQEDKTYKKELLEATVGNMDIQGFLEMSQSLADLLFKK